MTASANGAERGHILTPVEPCVDCICDDEASCVIRGAEREPIHPSVDDEVSCVICGAEREPIQPFVDEEVSCVICGAEHEPSSAFR